MDGQNYVVFHNDGDDSYMNSSANFRGAETAANVVNVYFKAAAVGGDGASAGYDKIVLAVGTAGNEERAVEAIAEAMAGAKNPVTIIADDKNGVYCDQTITGVTSITLSAMGTFKTVTALTSATNIEKYDSGKVFTLTQASAHSHTLPTASDAGAGWHAKFILVTAGGNAVKVIPDSTEDTLIGMIPPSDDGTAGTSAESGVDELVWVASTAAAGDWAEVVCDGSNFYVSGGQHDATHITIS